MKAGRLIEVLKKVSPDAEVRCGIGNVPTLMITNLLNLKRIPKYEFSLKVCETWKDLINIKTGITLDDEEIERISAYLEVMTDGFSTIQPIMEECIS